MDVAGEFIYTASLLIHIKSKMLLPRSPAGPDDAAEDPRRELVERLLEHERFKNAAQMLQQKQMLEAATWTNPGFREFQDDAAAEPEIAADTVDLVRIFRDILERARNRPVLDVEEDSVTVGQMIQFLARRLTMEDKPVALRRLLAIRTPSARWWPCSWPAGAGPPAGGAAPPGPRLQRHLHQEAHRLRRRDEPGRGQRPRRLAVDSRFNRCGGGVDPLPRFAHELQWNLGVVDVFIAIVGPLSGPFCEIGFNLCRGQKIYLDQFDSVINGKHPIHLPILPDNVRVHMVVRGKALA